MILNKSIKSFFKVMYSEIKSQFTITKFAIMIFVITFSLLVVFIDAPNLNSAVNKNSNIVKKLSFRLATQAIGQGVTYAFLIRIASILKDRSGVDKNRVSYLIYNKNIISIGKLFASSLIFLIHIVIIISLTPILITKYGTGVIEKSAYGDFWEYFLCVMFIYILTCYGVQLLNVSIKNKKLRIVLIAILFIITLVWFLIGSILLSLSLKKGSSIENVGNFVKSNYKIIPYVPFLNLLIPQILFLGMKDYSLVHALPLILYTILFIAFTWTFYTKNLKENLCL